MKIPGGAETGGEAGCWSALLKLLLGILNLKTLIEWMNPLIARRDDWKQFAGG